MSEKTKVVRIRRCKGEIVQDCDVYIGRACCRGGWHLRRSKWANPFCLRKVNNNRQLLCKLYRRYILKQEHLMQEIHTLKGKTLGCWCKPKPCHGDVLADLSNKT